MSPRWALALQARVIRQLSNTGMKRHHASAPASPQPSKVISIPTRTKGISIKLYFYFPASYTEQEPGNPRTHPVVVNFHGGGFAFGTATYDARWCRAVTEYADAVAVSVEYRLAPEYPFPIAIEDGVDATLYLMNHAEELRLDHHRIALSGFSAGGNMAFTVPILLHHENKMSTTNTATSLGTTSTLPGTIVSIASWYPTLDYSRTRAQRRASNPRPDQNLPSFLTSICDASYLHSPSKSKPVDLTSPWLSPGIASDNIIRHSLPNHIIIYACEYDMLLAEAKDFRERLGKDFEEKKVVYHVVKGVRHAWDKGPVWDPKNEDLYKDVCMELKSVFFAAPTQSESNLVVTKTLGAEPTEKEEVNGTA